MSWLKSAAQLIANVFRRPVTVEESFGYLPATFRWLPRRDDEKCTGCGACYERCSSGATKLNDAGTERTVTVDGFNCIYCGRCAEICPEGALQLTFEGQELPEDGQALADRVSLNRYAGEKAPTTDTTLKLQKCTVCGEIMPETEKHLRVVRERTLKNLKPETAAAIEKDMEKYLTACVSCRQKYSLVWGTHPRKWVGEK